MMREELKKLSLESRSRPMHEAGYATEEIVKLIPGPLPCWMCQLCDGGLLASQGVTLTGSFSSRTVRQKELLLNTSEKNNGVACCGG